MAAVEEQDALLAPQGGEKVTASSLQDKDIDASFAALAKVIGSQHVPTLSDREREILELYDQLSELRLEKALLEAQTELDQQGHQALQGEGDAPLAAQLASAERACLDARASFTLTNSIVHSALQADPILKAVHSGPNANPTERALHPLIDIRDLLSLCQANLSSELHATQEAITLAQAKNIKSMRKNAELTKELMGLTKQIKSVDLEAVDNAELKARVEALRRETKEAKETWRVMKSLAAGIVVGSGVDWASDETLLEMVLDDEE